MVGPTFSILFPVVGSNLNFCSDLFVLFAVLVRLLGLCFGHQRFGQHLYAEFVEPSPWLSHFQDFLYVVASVVALQSALSFLNSTTVGSPTSAPGGA